MKRPVAIGWLVVLATACMVEAITHDPVKASSDGAVFLRSVYIDENYSNALSLAHEELRQSVDEDGLRELANETKTKAGNLQELFADSYLQTPGDTIELFFVGRHDRGNIYHRLVLKGDASRGYRVSGLWFRSHPYPRDPSRKVFSERQIIR